MIFSRYKYLLTILQLENYDVYRFIRWILSSKKNQTVKEKRSLTFTTRLRLIVISLLTLQGLLGYFLIHYFGMAGIVVSLFSLFFPFIWILGASIVLYLPGRAYDEFLFYKTKRKIKDLDGTKVIAVTGSYGKSSTKEFLYNILRNKYRVLRTPESYNTISGISRVVDYELCSKYDYFICEMGAYQRGDIGKMCKMVMPDFGILTGITFQHYERFLSLENIIDTKFELWDSINLKSHIVLNMDDKNIEAQVNAKYLKGFVESSIESPKSYFRMSGVSFSKEGSSFSLLFGKNKISMKVPLFGYVHIRNLVLAMNAAKTIGMKDKDIIEAIHDIKQVPSRLELVHKGSSTVVNNTYSSNFVGFMELLETAKTVNGRKALLTPGIVELGPKEEEIHKKMGSLASDIFDKLILVGKNSRTISIAAGVKNKQRLTYIEDSRRSYRDYIKSLYGKYDWIFLENDVTQNY